MPYAGIPIPPPCMGVIAAPRAGCGDPAYEAGFECHGDEGPESIDSVRAGPRDDAKEYAFDGPDGVDVAGWPYWNDRPYDMMATGARSNVQIGICDKYFTSNGGLAHMVERSLSMREARGSIPWSSTFLFFSSD